MSEQVKKLEFVKSKVDKLNRIWKQFPDFMQPDIEAFKSGLVIGNVPKKYSLSPTYDGLKPDYVEALKKAYDSFPMPKDTFTDHDTGKTYLSMNFLSFPEPTIEDYLAYQVGLFIYMKGHRIEGKNFDEEELAMSNAYMGEFCERVPNQKDIYITRRGFERRLFFKDGTFIAELPSKGELESEESFNVINDIYPQAFSLMTRAALNRNGDINAVIDTIKKGEIYPKDLAIDSLHFSLFFYILSHLMEDNPWIIFDSLVNGDTTDTNRTLHEGLDKKDIEGNLLGLFISNILADKKLNERLKEKLDIALVIQKQVDLYWKSRLN